MPEYNGSYFTNNLNTTLCCPKKNTKLGSGLVIIVQAFINTILYLIYGIFQHQNKPVFAIHLNLGFKSYNMFTVEF
jgi:hypothetical protein